MKLLIDSGNTRIKVRLPDGSTVALRAPDELTRFAVTEAVGVNVAGEARARAIENACACPVRWLRPEPQTLGLQNRYAPTLGADRWAAMVGLHAHAETFMAASFGTATTIDTVAAHVFIGGLILPGPQLMRAALAQNTADLPLAEGAATFFPTDTHAAIESGIAAAQAGALLRQCLAARERLGHFPALYVTGGAWPGVRDEIERLLTQAGGPVPIHCENPVLDGIAAWGACGGA